MTDEAAGEFRNEKHRCPRRADLTGTEPVDGAPCGTLPDGRAVPFCAYNTLGYRQKVRQQQEEMQ